MALDTTSTAVTVDNAVISVTVTNPPEDDPECRMIVNVSVSIAKSCEEEYFKDDVSDEDSDYEDDSGGCLGVRRVDYDYLEESDNEWMHSGEGAGSAERDPLDQVDLGIDDSERQAMNLGIHEAEVAAARRLSLGPKDEV